MDREVLAAAHRHSSQHRDEIGRSTSVGCFHCEQSYPAAAIAEWWDDAAVCPKCGIDSVIGDASGFPVSDPTFLKAMHVRWFEEVVPSFGDDDEQRSHYKRAFSGTPLFRPVGPEELDLIEKSGFTSFPPRLPDQPIFYPVTNEAYATQIARDWNTKHGSRRGFVTRFWVDTEYVSKFERQIVGGREHEELWVPAEELAEFNRNIIGKIEVIAEFVGEQS